jgi:hypothetical protein
MNRFHGFNLSEVGKQSKDHTDTLAPVLQHMYPVWPTTLKRSDGRGYRISVITECPNHPLH